jgi:predicted transposase/invertase (TIGR01784 family)
MQKAKVKFFKDRALFYSTFPIKEQIKRGEWDFQLLPIYFIAILDFQYDEAEEIQKFRRDVCLKDQDGEVFYDKLHFKFLQMPLFTKQENELDNHFEKWIYFLKHLADFDHIPDILNEPIFQKGFEIAELAHLTPRQFDTYQKSLMEYAEVKNVSDTAFEEGEKKGLEKGIAQGMESGEQAKAREIARALKDKEVDLEIIAVTTGLSEAEIAKL